MVATIVSFWMMWRPESGVVRLGLYCTGEHLGQFDHGKEFPCRSDLVQSGSSVHQLPIPVSSTIQWTHYTNMKQEPALAETMPHAQFLYHTLHSNCRVEPAMGKTRVWGRACSQHHARFSCCSRVTAAVLVALVAGPTWLPSFALMPPKDSAEDEPPKLLGAARASSERPESTGQADAGPVPFARVAPRKFQILFTCKICETRNSHMISRLAYQQGIVIATCPGCGSRHLLADKTGLLDVGIWDVEQLAQQGENVTRLTTDGYQKVGADLQLEDLPNMVQEEKSPLLVRNKDGLIEALPEENLGVSRAADFMADTADEPVV